MIEGNENKHISIQEMSQIFSVEFNQILGICDQPFQIALLGKSKLGIDSTTKFIVSTTNLKSNAVIICSRPSAPNLVQRGVDNSEEIRNFIGEELGSAIIKPIHSGYINGLSYVVLPYYREFSTWKPLKIVQKIRITPLILKWLQDVNKTASTMHIFSNETIVAYRLALEHLGAMKNVSKEVSIAIDNSLNRMENGLWNPHHTIDHNDMWIGNVLLVPREECNVDCRYPFIIIDWNGANLFGYGIYDLIRLSGHLRLSKNKLHNELVAHANALRCELIDTRGHLLASLGHLHQELEYFPEEKYLKTLNSCWRTLNIAIK